MSNTCKDGEILCSGGMDGYGNCPMQDYCNAPVGDCPAICNPPACNYNNGESFCPYGVDSNGCWLGGYCSEPNSECAKTAAIQI